MATIAATETTRENGPEGCVARSVADTLAEEPGLEAVTIDRAHQKISVATIGRADVEKLTERITHKLAAAQSVSSGNRCRLLAGKDDCETCRQPLTETERRKITIRAEGDATTISRVTCPTAPKFWRWRDLPSLASSRAPLSSRRKTIITMRMNGNGSLRPRCFAEYAGWRRVFWRLRKKSKSACSWRRTWPVDFFRRKKSGSACKSACWTFIFSCWPWRWARHALAHGWKARRCCFCSHSRAHWNITPWAAHKRKFTPLFREAPKTATAIDVSGTETEVAVEKIRTGARLLIKPGTQFPVDAEIVRGSTAADESNLTGESAPVEKKIGDLALAGTINLWGAVEVLAARPAAESSLQKIIKLIKDAQQQKAPAQQFADKFSTYYTYAVLSLSLAMFFVWWLGFGLPAFTSAATHSAFYRTMTLLVVSSPCALVLSIPSAVLAAIAFGARHGILFRGGAAVEKLAGVNVVCLDKTGTLTTGELRVEKIESFPPGRESEIARLAYSLEKLSAHPLARAITRHGKQQGLQPVELQHFESITGQGLKARLNGVEVRLGGRDVGVGVQALACPGTQVSGGADKLKLELQRELQQDAPAEAGFSEVWVQAGDLLGRVILRDDIRPQSASVVDELRAEGLRSIVLTGDRRAAADHLRAELKLDDVRAGLKPEQKLAVIRELSAQGNRVAMIGDGVNDAPSLAAAHIGVAMGARGSDAALEQSDVVLMHDRLENFLSAFRLSQRARAVIRQNLVISLGTVVVLVTFAMLGKIPLTLGVVGHEGSTVVVVMNSLRLLFGGAKK